MIWSRRLNSLGYSPHIIVPQAFLPKVRLDKILASFVLNLPSFSFYLFTFLWGRFFVLYDSVLPVHNLKINFLCQFTLAGIYLFKFNNGNTRTMCEICSKLTIKTPKWHQQFVKMTNLSNLRICEMWGFEGLTSTRFIIPFHAPSLFLYPLKTSETSRATVGPQHLKVEVAE